MHLVIKVISSPWFWVDVFFGTVGAVVVYWGLWVEKKAERHIPPETFKPDIFDDIVSFQKQQMERGWRILMIGITIEAVAAFGLSILSGLEIAGAKEQAAGASKIAAEANARSKQLEVVGEKAKESAARATAEAERAKAERERAESGRLELEKQVLAQAQQIAQSRSVATNALFRAETAVRSAASRHVTAELRRKFVANLEFPKAPFKVPSVHLVGNASDIEGNVYMGEISLMLKEAGYVNGDMPVIYEPLPDGLTMAYPKSLIPNTVTSVYRAMTNAGFVMQLLRDDRAQENVITIYVGKKPDISN